MSMASTCLEDMFKKAGFFDRSPGYVDAIATTAPVERREGKIAAGLILISGVT
jgi:hypothetical protein